jgi:polar amino acid transport system substrate-binding protein
VGYGDKVPITFWGRLIALLWMFISMILITAFTAFVTTKLALFDVARIQGPGTLRKAIVGTVEGSASVDLLRKEDIAHRVYPTVAAAIDGLLAHDVNALVYGSVVLRYYAERDEHRRIEVLPGHLESLSLAFPLRDDSPLRDPINGALRRVLDESHWNDLKDRYLGSGRSGSAPR